MTMEPPRPAATIRRASSSNPTRGCQPRSRRALVASPRERPDISETFDSPLDGHYKIYPGGTRLDEAADSVNGKATLALGTYSTAKTFGWIKDNYSGKHVSMPMPFGIAKTDAFIMKISDLFGTLAGGVQGMASASTEIGVALEGYNGADLDRLHRAGARAAAVLALGDGDYLVSAVPAQPVLAFWGVYHLALGASLLAADLDLAALQDRAQEGVEQCLVARVTLTERAGEHPRRLGCHPSLFPNQRVDPLNWNTQVLGELFWTITRSIPDPLSPADAVTEVERHARTWQVVSVSRETALHAVRAAAEHQIPYWDALIWAAAKLAGIRVVLSEDFQDGREIEGVTFQNPFPSPIPPPPPDG